MKLSYLFGAGALLAVGCGQFSEVTVQVQNLNANKLTNALFIVAGNNELRSVTIQDVRIKFLDATLVGQKNDTVLFADQDAEFGDDDELVDIDLDENIVEADLFDALEVTIDQIEVTATVDRDGLNGDEEATIELLFEDVGADLTFNFEGFDSTKQNANIVLDLDISNVFFGIDFNDANLVAFDAAQNAFIIDADNNADALDFVDDFINEPASISGAYFLSEQAERVKP